MFGLLRSILWVIIPFAILIFLYVIKGLGAGDIKLFCALGAYVKKEIIWIIAISFIIAAVISLVIIIGKIIKNVASENKENEYKLTKIHFSIYILGGVLIFLVLGKLKMM